MGNILMKKKPGKSARDKTVLLYAWTANGKRKASAKSNGAEQLEDVVS